MLAYLFSRYPVVSQTFCDSEMLALEGLGVPLLVGSLNPPPDSFRHPRLATRKAPVFYPPPSKALEAMRRAELDSEAWRAMSGLVAEHDEKYGEGFKAATRARNALYFGHLFRSAGVDHVHVHFANRATHTALFLKRGFGIPFSFTAHAQDFMVDLGSDELLAEMAREATFVAGVSEFSCGLLREKCPESAEKIVRVYNGLDPESFPAADVAGGGDVLRIVTVGRLIEFKGFQHLIAACGLLKERGVAFELNIVGEGPWEEQLRALAAGRSVGEEVNFAGVLDGDQIRDLLASSQVFALASIVDSKGASDILPTVIAEAMAAGLPVVSTTLAGIPEMVDHGVSGLLCEPGDEKALADALQKLATEADTRTTYGEAGAKLARQRFALEVTAKQLLGLFPPEAANEPARPRVAYLASSWGSRDQRSTDPELRAAAAHPAVVPVAFGLDDDFRVSTTPPPPGLHFVADEVVLEAAQRAAPDKAERYDRIALYLAEFLGALGVERVHAARADVAGVAAQVAELLGVESSCCVEEGAERPSGMAVLEGLDLSIRKTRRRIGPFRFRVKPTPITGRDAEAFVDRLASC